MPCKCKRHSLLPACVVLAFAMLLGACSATHPITIIPNPTLPEKRQSFSDKNAGYVMTDVERDTIVETAGGGSDKVSYAPYKDLEQGLRLMLKGLYRDVFPVNSAQDAETLKANDISIVFTPEIQTASSSKSSPAWAPSQFTVVITATATDPAKKVLATVQGVGEGTAAYMDFLHNPGLSGRRAAEAALIDLAAKIRANPDLK